MSKKANKTKASHRRSTESVLTESFEIPTKMPVLPARDVVGFPGVVMSVFVAREQSMWALEKAAGDTGVVFLLSQKDTEQEKPTTDGFHQVGVVASVLRTLELSDGRVKVFLQGLIRARPAQIEEQGAGFYAEIDPIQPQSLPVDNSKAQALVNRIRENLQVLVGYEQVSEELLLITEEAVDVGVLCDVIVAHLQLDPAKAQAFLAEPNPSARLKMVDELITDGLNQYLVSERIRDQTRDEIAKGQHEYFLREQMKQIQRELGDGESPQDDLAHLRQALDKAGMSESPRKEADKQLKRLQMMSPESSDYAMLRGYLEWFADLPWSKTTKDIIDITKAKKILDKDHHGLEKVKDRILEYLSVRKLNPESRGPILCFVGPPGVGKTSLGRSIAQALGRKFVRMSLGGVRDEAEIRGHRRTYVGALPGRVIQGLKQAESKNPVFVLDELDKIGADFRGDPAAALLEVLDPQQNQEFRDHYLGVPFDLSSVMFIATANTIDTIPDALLDRLEVIQIAGYTTSEKIAIAERYLFPRQFKENGLKKSDLAYDKKSLLFVIERYTREAGVRNLEREAGALCRKVARKIAEKQSAPSRLTPPVIEQLLGRTKYDPEENDVRELVGLARGLAWTAVGGELLPIEVSVAKGTGQLHLTGQLGEVMQESAQAAVFYARSHAKQLGLDPEFHSKSDIHVHVPNGATPKDGPSAGITIATALVSALSSRKVAKDVAMTGEITLRGIVMPIGGLKEKALAALRYNMKRVIIPYENIKDLDEIPAEQRKKIKFIPVRDVGEVFEIALVREKPQKEKRSGRNRAVATTTTV